MSSKAVQTARIRRGVELKGKGFRTDDSIYPILEKAKALLAQVFNEADPEKIKLESPNDLYKCSVALSALLKAQVEFEKWHAERTSLLEDAVRELCHDAVGELRGQDPELYERFIKAIHHAARRSKKAKLPE